ncbi:hypothetical protein L228DRAFT_165352 [Xylona heveae TC161]|uniref:Uncharacterized protein n=1 Tax=Xylona heveae (strain CBS 132557 / TC161) TaxID=1328760 RepID=A0A165FJH7_XYLHT|nr:hypothetical protein L228DRAFT_165352 [Xylona heveae TC161]KZF21048.1 hypothetical protein L228DRAFT_165352 [Xylona heveae TC161]
MSNHPRQDVGRGANESTRMDRHRSLHLDERMTTDWLNGMANGRTTACNVERQLRSLAKSASYIRVRDLVCLTGVWLSVKRLSCSAKPKMVLVYRGNPRTPIGKLLKKQTRTIPTLGIDCSHPVGDTLPSLFPILVSTFFSYYIYSTSDPRPNRT